MKYSEYIKLAHERAQSHPKDKNGDEALKTVAKVSDELYIHLHDGIIRKLAVRSLREILSTLPEKPTEQDINKVIHLIEGVILTVISCILSEGEIITVKRNRGE